MDCNDQSTGVKEQFLLSNDSLSDKILETDPTKIISSLEVSSSFSFGDCRICKDKASGIHYGVATCEGCKGFFKRSLSKHMGFICLQKNECKINKITRNRCKACRFKICLKKGMSIDGIKMGRMSKVTKQKTLNRLADQSDSDSNEISSIQLKEMKNQALEVFKGPTNRGLTYAYTRNQFEEWLKPQLEKIKNNELNSLNKGCIFLSLSTTMEYISQPVDKVVFDFLNHSILFDPLSIMPRTVFQNDPDFPKIVLVKNKICQIYKEHIKNSIILNSTYERLKNKDYIDSSVKEVSKEKLVFGLIDTFLESAKWMSDYVKDLNSIGTKKLCSQDLSTIITQSIYFFCALNSIRFTFNNESYSILKNGIQLTRKRFIQIYGYDFNNLHLEFHSKFIALELTDNEMALFNAFALTSCNPDLMVQREDFIETKNLFKKALIYEFELNRRDKIFLKNFEEVCNICNILETYKDDALMSIKDYAAVKMNQKS